MFDYKIYYQSLIKSTTRANICSAQITHRIHILFRYLLNTKAIYNLHIMLACNFKKIHIESTCDVTHLESTPNLSIFPNETLMKLKAYFHLRSTWDPPRYFSKSQASLDLFNYRLIGFLELKLFKNFLVSLFANLFGYIYFFLFHPFLASRILCMRWLLRDFERTLIEF